MTVLDITKIDLQWSDINSRVNHPAPNHKRSKGIHVSGVLKYIAQELNLLKPDEDRTDEMPMVIGGGMAFESWIVGLYPKMIWQPGEVRRDGVAGSPDGTSRLEDVMIKPLFTHLGPVVEEFKRTYKSSRNRQDITHEWLWMNQIMAYVNMIRPATEGPGFGRLHVEWVNGDYKYPLQPVYLRYLIRFSEGDLKNNWSLIRRYKDKAKRED